VTKRTSFKPLPPDEGLVHQERKNQREGENQNIQQNGIGGKKDTPRRKSFDRQTFGRQKVEKLVNRLTNYCQPNDNETL